MTRREKSSEGGTDAEREEREERKVRRGGSFTFSLGRCHITSMQVRHARIKVQFISLN